jgi:DinB superfamily
MAQDPDTPILDDKDWTWVLERPCPECGFVAGTPRPDIGTAVRSAAERVIAALARPDVRARPAPAVWSPLEYGCHVRDVLEICGGRLDLMLATENASGASFANWDQDATAVEKRYWESDPRQVATEIAAAADQIAARFDGVSGAEWEHVGHRSNGSVFTVETFGWYVLHDVVHHAHDVRV